MSNKKQTAVEWLMENLDLAKDAFTQAKEMEKEQIVEAWVDGNDTQPSITANVNAEKYYNETYNN